MPSLPYHYWIFWVNEVHLFKYGSTKIRDYKFKSRICIMHDTMNVMSNHQRHVTIQWPYL
jgi:hypothetical protein